MRIADIRSCEANDFLRTLTFTLKNGKKKMAIVPEEQDFNETLLDIRKRMKENGQPKIAVTKLNAGNGKKNISEEKRALIESLISAREDLKLDKVFKEILHGGISKREASNILWLSLANTYLKYGAWLTEKGLGGFVRKISYRVEDEQGNVTVFKSACDASEFIGTCKSYLSRRFRTTENKTIESNGYKITKIVEGIDG